MTVKESVKQVLDSLPDDSTLDDVIHALYIKAKIERGESEIREGKGVSDEEARERLRKWAG
jgi:predicted transcriptional regulator